MAVAANLPLATVGVIELVVFTGTAVPILVLPAQEVVSSKIKLFSTIISGRVASLNVMVTSDSEYRT